LWHTDSKNCVSIIEKGSTNACLNEFALEIFKVCAKNAITLRVVWLSRDESTIADSLSKMIDFDDYGVKKEFFDYVDALFGPHDVDRFANEVNHLLPRYNSLAWTPSTEAVDAFSVSWKNDNNNPVNLIPKAINHLVACKGQGTLVAPYWPSSPFFPMIFGEDNSVREYVSEVLWFNCPHDIYVQGRNSQSIFGTNQFTSDVIVVRFICK